VRRERMGHIELAAPVLARLVLQGLPSRIGHLLDITLRELERVLYFEAYVVVDPGETGPQEPARCSPTSKFRQLARKYGDGKFVAKMGAEAIKELLAHRPRRAGRELRRR
jgi:DNA-directed RNA polymerase subunit beta'